MTYSEAANLAVNQTLVRSINTSIIALLPVAAILFVGVGFLGAGTLKDLALALFVGIAAGTYSSIFIATPLLCQLKEHEPAMKALAKRVEARRRPAQGSRQGAAGQQAPAAKTSDRGASTPARRPRRRSTTSPASPQPTPTPSEHVRREPQPAQRQQAAQDEPAAEEAPVTCRPALEDCSTPAAQVRDVPDWPLPGVVFKDITPLLADRGRASRRSIDALVDGVDAPGRRWTGSPASRPAASSSRRRSPTSRRRLRPRAQGRASCRGDAARGVRPRVRRRPSLEVRHDAFTPGDRVLVVDDVLATGGTPPRPSSWSAGPAARSWGCAC